MTRIHHETLGKIADALPVDVVVCIPAARLAEIEKEEADVAGALSRGEGPVYYYWSVGRLPKVQPRRIYFIWNGAVRAYHRVVGMESGKIWMDHEIVSVPPIEMKGFRAWRYYKGE